MATRRRENMAWSANRRMIATPITRARLFLLAILLIGCSGESNAPNAPSTDALAAITITGVQSTHIAGEKVSVAAKATRNDSRPLPGVPITFSSGGGGIAAPVSVITDADGVATTTWTVPAATGTAELRATSGSTTARVTTVIQPAAAARINKVGGDAQQGVAGEPLPGAVRISITDAFGNGIAGRAVTFVVTAGGGTLATTSAGTAADGTASAIWRLGDDPQNTLEIRSVDLSPVAFTATSRVLAGTFALTGSMSTPRDFHTATLLRDGRVLVSGGLSTTDPGSELATAELYDPATGTFTRTANDMTVARVGHSATLLADGRVLIAGGSRGAVTNVLSNVADLFDPATNRFVQTGNLIDGQSWHEGTLLRSGEVLITGGGTRSNDVFHEARAELYDPATGTFRYTGAYADVIPPDSYNGLVAVSATLLGNGKVLLASLPRAELYDPATGTFAGTGAMLTNTGWSYISGRPAALLLNGKVLLTGGEQEDVGRFPQAELYDPATGAFVFTTRMPYPRSLHTETLLASGRVLLTGGESFICDESRCPIYSLSNAEVYDMNGVTVTAVAPMKVSRETHRATRLNDGRVLITGGLTFMGGLNLAVQYTVLNSAELYTERP
jgi:hypothetical protein